jgi:hypothetical protein
MYKLSFMGLVLLAVVSCKKDKSNDPALVNVDQFMLTEAQKTSGYRWFNDQDSVLAKSAGSSHSQPFLRTRYNSIAAQMLNSEGRIIPGASFPDGSIIVKDLMTSETVIDQYAVLYKDADHPDADSKGWVWGYIKANGTVTVSASSKGSSCISCHSQSGNIDYTLMNKFFP